MVIGEKKKGTIECDKSTIKCEKSTVKCDNRTIICEKIKIESPNVTKVQLHVIFGTAQFEDGTIKCQKKYEYNRTWQKYHSVYFGTLNKNEKR